MFVGRPIYQETAHLPKAQDRTILMSSWVINGMPAGLCFREDTNKVTNNNSEFLPHLVTKDIKINGEDRSYDFRQSSW